MNKHWFSTSLLVLFLSFFSVGSFAADSLVGHWVNNKIDLNLKVNKRYIYKVKILGVRKTFRGNWSATTKVITLKYKLLGNRKKTATYSFSRGDLLLTQKGKTSRLKRK